MNKNDLVKFYAELEERAYTLVVPFDEEGFDFEVRYENGQTYRDEAGEEYISMYPVPNISLQGLCSINVDPDFLEVHAHIPAGSARALDLEKLKDCTFTAREYEKIIATSVEDLETALDHIEYFRVTFDFILDKNTSASALYEFVLMLQKQGFSEATMDDIRKQFNIE